MRRLPGRLRRADVPPADVPRALPRGGRGPAARRDGMIAYLTAVQREDGSVGLHAEDRRGSMFCTSLAYVGYRVLGLPPDDSRVQRMRGRIHAHGSTLAAASWGKFVLCLLGLYDWRGFTPSSPSCGCFRRRRPCTRVASGAIAARSTFRWHGSMAVGQRSPRARSCGALRHELYEGKWTSIDWTRHRDTIAAGEAYRPTTVALRATNRALEAAERVMPARLRASGRSTR